LTPEIAGVRNEKDTYIGGFLQKNQKLNPTMATPAMEYQLNDLLSRVLLLIVGSSIVMQAVKSKMIRQIIE